MDKQFTWIPFYKELSDWLLGKQNSQPELISTLKEIGITGFRDDTERGKEITLQEIDPFTFLAYLNKFHSNEKRVEPIHTIDFNKMARNIPRIASGTDIAASERYASARKNFCKGNPFSGRQKISRGISRSPAAAGPS